MLGYQWSVTAIRLLFLDVGASRLVSPFGPEVHVGQEPGPHLDDIEPGFDAPRRECPSPDLRVDHALRDTQRELAET